MISSAFAGLPVDGQSLDGRVTVCITRVVVSCSLYMVLLLFVLWVLLYCFSWMRRLFLGAFGKLRIATISFVMSVRLSLRMEQLDFPWKDFNEIQYFSIIWTFVKKNPSFIKIWQE